MTFSWAECLVSKSLQFKDSILFNPALLDQTRHNVFTLPDLIGIHDETMVGQQPVHGIEREHHHALGAQMHALPFRQQGPDQGDTDLSAVFLGSRFHDL